MLRKEHASDAVSVATDVSRLFWHNTANIDFGVSPSLNSLMVHMQCRQGGMLPAFLFSVDRSDKLLLFSSNKDISMHRHIIIRHNHGFPNILHGVC